MEQLNLFKLLKEKSSLIINNCGYSESILEDDDYLHDFLIDCKQLFSKREFEILLAYNSILQHRVANHIPLNW